MENRDQKSGKDRDKEQSGAQESVGASQCREKEGGLEGAAEVGRARVVMSS